MTVGVHARRRRLPAFQSLSGYDRGWLRGDLIAGLTVWAILVPEALAYATIAGVSPVVGLYAAPAALVLYAAFGSSRYLIVGPMSATAALSAAAVADLTTGGPDEVLAFTGVVALMTGAYALAAGVLRLGFLASFISEPVLKGFIIGMALTIIIGQVPTIFGVEKEDGSFFRQLWGFIGNLGDTQVRTLVVGVMSLVIVLALRRVAPVVPASLVAVIAGVIAVDLFDLESKGVAIVGPIDSGLPSIGPPDGLGLSDYLAAAGPAAGIMLVGFAEGLGAAKTYAARERAEINTNRELIGLGAANIGSGFVSGMVVNGSLSKTAVDWAAGARSQLSGITAAALTVITLLFLTDLFENLPEATLAAVVIAAVVELVDFASLKRYYDLYSTRLGRIYGHAARADFIAAVAAMLGVLVFDTLPGLVIGIVMSLLLLLYRASKPYVAELGQIPGAGHQYTDLDRHPDNAVEPGVPVLRVESGLFFANADAVRATIKSHAAAPGTKGIVLDAEAIAFVDVTAVRMLEELAVELAGGGQQLVIAHELGQVGDLLDQHGSATDLRVYATIDEAVVAVRDG